MSIDGEWNILDRLEQQLALVQRWERSRVVESVGSLLDAFGGRLPRRAAARLSEESGWSARGLWRIAGEIRNPAPDPDELAEDSTFLDRLAAGGRFEFDDLAITMMYMLGGNQRRFREVVIEAGYTMPSEATVCREWAKVDRRIRDGAKWGQRRRYHNVLYVRQVPPDVANAVWEVDDFDLDLRVLIEAEGEPAELDVKVAGAPTWAAIRPHLTLVIDQASRFVVAWMLLDHVPTSDDVSTLFADAFEVRGSDYGGAGYIGGACELIVTDNASCFSSFKSVELFAAVPTQVDPAFAYQPHQKGAVERAGQTIQSLIVTGLGGVVTRSQTISGAALLDTDPTRWIEFAQLEAIVATAVLRYNYERKHRTIGCTPASRYLELNTAPREVPDWQLADRYRPVSFKQGWRTVTDTGIEVFGKMWLAADLLDVAEVGDRVQVRRLHHRLDRLAVFNERNDFLTMVTADAHEDPDLGPEIAKKRKEHAHQIYRYAAAAREAMTITADAVNAGDAVDHVAASLEARANHQARREAAAAAAADEMTDTSDEPTVEAAADEPTVPAGKQIVGTIPSGIAPIDRPAHQIKVGKALQSKPPSAPQRASSQIEAAEAAAERRRQRRANERQQSHNDE